MPEHTSPKRKRGKPARLERDRRRAFAAASSLALRASVSWPAVDRPRIFLRERIHEKGNADQRSQPEECRIAICEDGLLEELYIERASQDNYVGNIYKGKIVNLEPSIQAAFVDFGVGRNGFLHISDVEPQYFRQGGYDPADDGEPMTPTWPIDDDDDDRDDEAASGDEGGGRGATRHVAPPRPHRRPPAHQAADSRHLPPRRRSARAGHQGRHRHQRPDALDLHQHSRPLPGADAGARPRRRLAQDRRRQTSAASCATSMLELNPPKGLGFIVRTAGIDRTQKELSRDMAYLLRLWKVIVRRMKKQPAPIDIYEESDMIIRTIRDIFTADIDAIYIDEPAAYERAKEFLQLVMPRYVNRAASVRRHASRCSTSTSSTTRSPRSTSARCR